MGGGTLVRRPEKPYISGRYVTRNSAKGEGCGRRDVVIVLPEGKTFIEGVHCRKILLLLTVCSNKSSAGGSIPGGRSTPIDL